MPDVNVLVAPLLGGVTRTDPSDLVALIMLVPIYVWLGRVPPRRNDPVEPPRLQHWFRWVLGTFAFAVSVISTTATSCYPTEGIASLVTEGDRIFAGTTYYPEIDVFDRGDVDTSWWVSDDGGETWSSAEHDLIGDPTAHGSAEACDEQGALLACYARCAGRSM